MELQEAETGTNHDYDDTDSGAHDHRAIDNDGPANNHRATDNDGPANNHYATDNHGAIVQSPVLGTQLPRNRFHR